MSDFSPIVFVQMNPQDDRPPYPESCKDTEKLCYGQSHPSGGTVNELPPPCQQAEPTASAVPGTARTEEWSTNSSSGLKQTHQHDWELFLCPSTEERTNKENRLPGTETAKSPTVPTSIGDGTAHRGSHSDKTDLVAWASLPQWRWQHLCPLWMLSQVLKEKMAKQSLFINTIIILGVWFFKDSKSARASSLPPFPLDYTTCGVSI